MFRSKTDIKIKLISEKHGHALIIFKNPLKLYTYRIIFTFYIRLDYSNIFSCIVQYFLI